MGWGADFIAAISTRGQPLQLRYDLELTQIGNVPANVGYRITSYGEGSAILQIADRGVRVTGSTLAPGTWSSTLGQMEIDLAGTVSDLRAAVTRGSFCVVYVHVWTGTRWIRELLGYGQVQQLMVTGRSSATLTLRDLLSALRSRPTVTAAQMGLFYTDGVTTTLTTKYHVGDASIDVASSSNFDRETGGNGAVLITPSHGDPFILRWSSKTATTFTLSGAAADQHGTIRTDAEIGDLVTALFLVEDHPIDAARKILVSLGSGANGSYDTLPAAWGLGLRDAWIDHDDCDLWRDISRPSMVWEVVTDVEVASPWEWMSGWLAAGGFYATIRQGRLTIRCALRSGRPGSVLLPRAGTTALTLTDADIEQVEVETWDSDAEAEAYNVTAYGPTTNASAGGEDLATLPAVYRAEYDLGELLFTSEADGLDSIVARVAEAHQRIPERYAIACAGMRAAQLAPGDQIQMDFSTTGTSIDPVVGIVTQVSPDWGACRVGLVVLVYPTSGEVWP